MRHGTARFGSLLIACTLMAASAGLTGCGNTKPKPPPVSRYTVLPPKTVPPYLKGTLLEQVDLTGTEPFVVNNYGLVSHLDHTGDSTASQAVRMFMIKEIMRHGFGSQAFRDYKDHDPEKVLRDPQNAIVLVDLYVPPGARKGQWTDVQVTALPESNTTSLAGGILFETDLKIRGTQDLEGAVQVHAVARGPVFINPAYATGNNTISGSEAQSKRRGMILDGGYIKEDRPLVLRVRTPSLRTARAVEGRIDQFFQETRMDQVAAAQDEGVVYLLTPRKFKGDWEHCAQLALHLYFNADPKFAAVKADELAKEALKPDAALLDISYCWEGLGPAALPYILPLMSNEKPEVAFAAARAAAFLNDVSAQTALEQMAKTPNNPFQLNAVQTLGAIPTNSPAINMKLRGLLDSDQTLVRIEAYRMLAKHRDESIYTRVINESFVLDIIKSKGPPLIYASRTGIPRIAVFGNTPSIDLPVTFMAMDSRFSITSPMDKDVVTLFYRDSTQPDPVKVISRPDVAEIIARLGGEGPKTEARMSFGYGDVVGIIQALADQKKLTAVGITPQDPVAFVLQENAALIDDIYNAPIIPDNSRPQVEESRPQGATEGTERNAEVGMQNAE